MSGCTCVWFRVRLRGGPLAGVRDLPCSRSGPPATLGTDGGRYLRLRRRWPWAMTTYRWVSA